MSSVERKFYVAPFCGKFRKKPLTSAFSGAIIATLICEDAGIGRQARLRCVCRTTCGFKSHSSHQMQRPPYGVVFLFWYTECFEALVPPYFSVRKNINVFVERKIGYSAEISLDENRGSKSHSKDHPTGWSFCFGTRNALRPVHRIMDLR